MIFITRGVAPGYVAKGRWPSIETVQLRNYSLAAHNLKIKTPVSATGIL